MLFNSYTFLMFFPIVVLCYYIMPKKFSWLFLLGASYYFYMGWRAEYAILLAGATVSTYFSAAIIDTVRKRTKNSSQKKLYCNLALWGGILLNLGVLFYFKYFNFGMRGISRILNMAGVNAQPLQLDIILPVGISFFTLQALGYLIDVSRGDISHEKNILRYALYVSFFPQLVAGPIERSKNLLPQLRERVPFDTQRAISGLRLMGWGLLQKAVIADRLAQAVDTVFSKPFDIKGPAIIAAVLLFAVQIYCDFSGYSDIAIGAAQVMGVRLMDNFKRPYFATNFSSFWSRWHISLSTWLQDYLFVPICWSRWTSKLPIIGKHITKVPVLSTILIVFLVSGLWHGASVCFVVWGALQGLYRIGEEIMHRTIGKPPKKQLMLKVLAKRVSVFLLFSFSLIFFRTPTVTGAVALINGMFALSSEPFTAAALGISNVNLIISLIFVIVLFFINALQEKKSVRERLKQKPFAVQCACDVLLIMTLLVFAVYGPGYATGQFIYFQF